MEKNISFTDLFDLEDIQKIQDAFALASNAASIITEPDGTPITKPSNFCRLCMDIIRKTPKGLANCMKSDAIIGRQNLSGPIMQCCLSGGLWDGGASISVGDTHIANWLIGQVRNETQDDKQMLRYADEIGADKEEFSSALAEVPKMSTAQFEKICDSLFSFANLLSKQAFQNMQLKKSEDRFSSLVERLNEAVYCMSLPDGTYDYFSPAAKAVFGYSNTEFMDNPLLMKNIIHPDFRDYFAKEWTNLLQGKVSPTYEYKISDPDGRERWIFQTNTGVFDENGKIIAMQGCCSDISDRKQSEEERELLLTHLNRVTAIMDQTSDFVAMSDFQGRILYINAAGLEMVGHTGADVTSLNIPDFHPPEISEKIMEEHLPVLMEKGIFSWEGALKHADGRVIPVSQVMMVIWNEVGEPDSLGTIMRDIAHRKRAEEILRASEEKYKQLAESLRKEITERERAENKIRRLNQEIEQRIKEKQGKYLTFMLAEEEYGISILKIREIVGMMPVTPVPNTPDFIKGVINLRGRVIPVTDLRRRLGLEASDYTDRTCIIVTELTGSAKNIKDLIGIIVDSVSEVLNINGRDVEDSPTFVSGETDYILGMAKAEGKVNILINTDILFKAEEISVLE